LKKANTRKPKPGPKITPKPTRKLEPESQEILEAPSKEKDPDFDPNLAEEPKTSVRRSRRGATKASSKAAGVNPFTPRVKIGDSIKQVDSVTSNKRKAEVPVKTPNISSRNRFSQRILLRACTSSAGKSFNYVFCEYQPKKTSKTISFTLRL